MLSDTVPASLWRRIMTALCPRSIEIGCSELD